MIVGIYTRVSTQEQAQEGFSIGEQETRLRKYCEAMNWQIYKVYTDPAFSGANMNRPSLRALIKDVEAGKLQKVLVYKLDRLSRSQLDTLYLIERVFLAHNVEFSSLTENFDTSTPLGRAMIGILSVFAQLEREQIKERMNMGKAARASLGLFHGGRAPHGYTYEPETNSLRVDPVEAAQIRRIFTQFTGHIPIKQICADLEATTGENWYPRSVRYILRNRVYLGEILHNGTWQQGTHEAIIDAETFEAAQSLLDSRRKYHAENRRDGKVTTYLGGLLYCGFCGAKFGSCVKQYPRKTGTVSVPVYGCYSRLKKRTEFIVDPACKNKIWNRADLDELVFNELRKLTLVPPERTEQPPEDYTEEIKRIDTQIGKLLDLYSVSGIPMDAVESRVSALNERRTILEEKQYQIAKTRRMDSSAFYGLIQNMDDILRLGTYAEIRELITTLIDRIIIRGEDVEIHWNF